MRGFTSILSPLLAFACWGLLCGAAFAETPVPDRAAAGAELAQAQAFDEAGNRSAAINAYRAVARNFAFTPEGATAQLRLAHLLEQTGNLNRAFDAYNEFLTRYPESDQFDDAIRAQVSIANQYLEGRRVRFVGIPLASGYDRAQKMYESIVATAPFSQYAPMAQFNLGLAYERQGKAQMAIDSYQRILDRYPASPVADDALYQIGYVYMQIGTRQGSQDLSSLLMAKNTFEDFLLQFPRSEKAAQAEANLELLTTQETDDIMGIARFYDRSRNFRAAFVYYNEAIRRNPGSQDAEIARIRIEELRSDYGDDALRTGPERVETGDRAVLRRRLQAQVESSALADYAGPPRDDVVREELPVVRPRLRTEARDVSPLPPVEPDLPTP